MPNVRVDFAVHVLAQNGLRQQVHLTAMLRSTRPQETVATAGGHLLQGAGGDRDHGAVQFVLDGTLGGIRAEHEPAVAGARRNIGVTCGKNLNLGGGYVLFLRQTVHQLLRVTTDRAVQGAARRTHRLRGLDRGGAQLNGVLAGITKRPRQVRMRLQRKLQRTHIAGTDRGVPLTGEVHAARMRIAQHLHRAEGLRNERRQLRIRGIGGGARPHALHLKTHAGLRRVGGGGLVLPALLNAQTQPDGVQGGILNNGFELAAVLLDFLRNSHGHNACGQVRLNHLSELALLQQQAVRQGAAGVGDIADIAQARLVRVWVGTGGHEGVYAGAVASNLLRQIRQNRGRGDHVHPVGGGIDGGGASAQREGTCTGTRRGTGGEGEGGASRIGVRTLAGGMSAMRCHRGVPSGVPNAESWRPAPEREPRC